MAFYLTLPSNSSLNFYPNNTPSHYFTKLPQDISLNGEYEVALSEIQISNTYFNVVKDECYIEYTIAKTAVPTAEDDDKDKGKTFVGGKLIVPGGLYESNEFLVYTLNTMLQKVLRDKRLVRFYYNKATKRVSVTVYDQDLTLSFSPKLQRVLGLSAASVTIGNHRGKYLMDVHEDFKSVYVYCDLVSARPVGDTMAPLLRILPAKQRTREVAHHIFEKPHYIPLSRAQFNTVELLLTTDKGKTIAFSSGNTIATLHFRHRRPDYL